MNTRTQQQTTPAIRGSWEDLLTQAQQHAVNFNDDAIPLFQRLFDGLRNLSQEQRKRGQGHLQALLVRTAMAYQGYLNIRDQHDESLRVLSQTRDLVDADDQELVDSQTVDVLVQAGRPDEAIALVRAQAEADDGKLGDWGRLVMTCVQADRPESAEPILEHMAEAIAAKRQNSAESEDELIREFAYLAGLRAIAALEREEWETGIESFEQAIAGESGYEQNMHLLYGRLVSHGLYEEAFTFIDRDRHHPIRAGFWRGLAHFAQGNVEQAQQAWRTVSTTDTSASEENSFFEYILAQYHLGDEEGSALSMVLQVIRSQPTTPWVMLLLAGLGWAIRGDLDTARGDLEVAVAQRKAAAEGRKLPKHYWFMVSNLLGDEAREQLAGFFEIEQTEAEILA